MYIGDVSSHNTVTDWRAYLADTPAVWVKATQASGPSAYTNPLFVGQFASARAAGGLVGAYHFADSRYAPAVDFAHFFDVAAPAGAFTDGALLPLLDIENTAGVEWTLGNVNSWVARFIAAYRLRTGKRKIIIYASRSFWQTIMRPNDWADADVYLMVAAYPGTVDWSRGLNQSGYSHPRLAVWQYTDAAPIAGMAQPGDRSRQVAFTPVDLTLGSRLNEGDDDVAPQPVLFLAAGTGGPTGPNGGQPLYPHGVWRDEFGVYVGLQSEGEAHDLLAAWPNSPKDSSGQGVWVEQATLAEWVRISRVNVDPPATAHTSVG
jgi:lysozyme